MNRKVFNIIMAVLFMMAAITCNDDKGPNPELGASVASLSFAAAEPSTCARTSIGASADSPHG